MIAVVIKVKNVNICRDKESDMMNIKNVLNDNATKADCLQAGVGAGGRERQLIWTFK